MSCRIRVAHLVSIRITRGETSRVLSHATPAHARGRAAEPDRGIPRQGQAPAGHVPCIRRTHQCQHIGPLNEVRDQCLAGMAAALAVDVDRRVRVRPGAARHRHRRPGLSVRSERHRRAAARVRAGHQTDLRSRLPHLPRRARGRRRLLGRTYAAATSGQRPGDAQQLVVVDCSPGGSMYRYFTGDAVTKATMVFRWMVVLQRRAEPLAPCATRSSRVLRWSAAAASAPLIARAQLGAEQRGERPVPRLPGLARRHRPQPDGRSLAGLHRAHQPARQLRPRRDFGRVRFLRALPSTTA